jgi:hypothetical protein
VTAHAHGRELPAELADLLADVIPADGGFGHRQHVHLAFIAVRRYGTREAVERVSTWIRHIAAYERAPQKYNATMTRACTEIVGHHVDTDGGAGSFAEFAARHPALLDKRLLRRHYSPGRLASAAARTGWSEPDLCPFSGQN